ncbi:Hypothetical predicted protein [Mytilus galloprovincialis]|uniref:Ankyrin repeat protein n=1 Tax=Mytilus galloprovincialis TaxID=29158 RepID=A0A8B6GGQ8_MYTGA|nr:Hypothetical predicted protein [Mytilus galloprovincialis]
MLSNPQDHFVLNAQLSKLSENDAIAVINDLVKYKRKVIQNKTSEQFNSRQSSARSTNESKDEAIWYNSNTYVYNEMTPLLEAFKNKDKPEILKLLIEGYLYINESNDNRITPIMKACEFGETYIDIINILVKETFDINTADKNGQTALFVACNQRNPSNKIVQILLTENRSDNIIDIQIGNNYGRTPLMTICSHKSNDNIDNIIDIIDLLMNYSHDPKLIDQKDKSEKTSLMYACKYGYIKIVKHLLHKNADINTRDIQGCTLLFVICNKPNPCYELVEYLFKEYRSHIIPDITIGNNSGVTPLMTLCSCRSYDYVDNVKKIINLLIKHSHAADCINQKDKSGKTCLMHACEHGHREIVDHLLQKNAEINAVDKNGHTALFSLCKTRNLRFDVVESLFKAKRLGNIPDIRIGNSYGRSPLMTLCTRGINDNVNMVIKIIELLIKQSPDLEFINQVDNSGQTSLMYACEYGHYKVVETLMQNKNLTINTRDKNGCTALFLTCSKRNPSYKIVKALFKEKDHSSDVTIGNNSGITPLMLLCSRGNEEQVSETIDILIQSSIDNVLVNQKDHKGKTALIHACEHKHIQIIKQLLDNGASITSECKEIAEIINDQDIITLIQMHMENICD